MKNVMRATSPAIKATVFLGMAALLVAGCASKKSAASNSAAPSIAAPSSAAAPATTSAAAAAAPSSAAAVAPAATAAAAGSSAAGPAGPASVDIKTGPLGKYLTDASGKTLYLYTPDTSPTSTCYGQCIAFWPALLTNGAPQAGSGATQTLLATSPRTDGTSQVTYNGHPLYYFKGDKAAGDTSGQGKEGTWFVLSPAGMQIGSAAPPSASASNAAKVIAPAPTKTAPTKAAPTKAAPTKAAPSATTPAPSPTKVAAPAPTPTKPAAGGGWA
jgi:predicted lipoprotein with Yx(FWY)xxD motif